MHGEILQTGPAEHSRVRFLRVRERRITEPQRLAVRHRRAGRVLPGAVRCRRVSGVGHRVRHGAEETAGVQLRGRRDDVVAALSARHVRHVLSGRGDPQFGRHVADVLHVNPIDELHDLYNCQRFRHPRKYATYRRLRFR